MRRLTQSLAIAVASIASAASADGPTLRQFLKTHGPALARVAPQVTGPARQHRAVRACPIVHVDNAGLGDFTAATERYLEVVIPAGKGHVFFRKGQQVFDHGPDGFRVGGVRPIRSDRYGVLVRLSAAQEQTLDGYLARLAKTGGAELGEYDFEGDRGYHCVSWLVGKPAYKRVERSTSDGRVIVRRVRDPQARRLALDGQGRNLVRILGGKTSVDGTSMPSFARFMLRYARSVAGIAYYHDGPMTPATLREVRFQVPTLRELVGERMRLDGQPEAAVQRALEGMPLDE